MGSGGIPSLGNIFFFGGRGPPGSSQAPLPLSEVMVAWPPRKCETSIEKWTTWAVLTGFLGGGAGPLSCTPANVPIYEGMGPEKV